MTMAKYTYYYFNGRGRAETTRLIFAASGTAYEDKRIPQEEWPTLKPKMPFGTLPVLEVDGQMIPQSIAIARYAARTTGLAGKTDIDQAQIEAITDLLTELREDGLIAAFTKDKDKQADLMTALKEKVPKYLKLLEGKMTKGQFLYGSSLTWADLHFYAVMECLAGPVPDALKGFPTLQDLQKRVAELPNVAKYLKDRPETPF